MLLLLLIHLSATQSHSKEGTLKTTFYFKIHRAAYPTLYAQIQAQKCYWEKNKQAKTERKLGDKH